METDNIEFNTAFWLKHYKKLKKEFWTDLSVVIFVICMIIICSGENSVEDERFEQAVKNYETTTGRKIYPSGREFLRKAAEQKGLKTESEIMELIKYNEKFMWK